MYTSLGSTQTQKQTRTPGNRAVAALFAASRCLLRSGSLLPIPLVMKEEATAAAFDAPTATGLGAGGTYIGVGSMCGVGRSPPMAIAGIRFSKLTGTAEEGGKGVDEGSGSEGGGGGGGGEGWGEWPNLAARMGWSFPRGVVFAPVAMATHTEGNKHVGRRGGESERNRWWAFIRECFVHVYTCIILLQPLIRYVGTNNGFNSPHDLIQRYVVQYT